MIKSKYIADIVHLLINADDVELKIRQQAKLICDSDYEYTDSGLFVTFTFTEPIENYRIKKNDLVLLGVEIISIALELEAEANLFFKSGIINNLEIWCYKGDYPKFDLPQYALKQAWTGSPGRQLTHR